ncbi:hypothetical protein ACWCXE_14265 [Streptomyces sp. NPDC001780]
MTEQTVTTSVTSDRSALQLFNISGTDIRFGLTADGREQNREMRVIFEDGLWELIFRSTLPGAKAIKSRVKAILREIRETGRYGAAALSPAQMLVEMAQQFLVQEQRLAAIEQEQAATAAKVEAIEGRHDWFTALGYAKLHDHPTDRPYLARVGKRATALLRESGVEPHRRQDATFGAVNTYPVSVLEDAFAGVRA